MIKIEIHNDAQEMESNPYQDFQVDKAYNLNNHILLAEGCAKWRLLTDFWRHTCHTYFGRHT